MNDLLALVHNHYVQWFTAVVTTCSFLHSVLPPYDWEPDFVNEGLVDFPSAQNAFHAVFRNRWYKLLIYVTGYVALNARSLIWRSISINNPNSQNVKNIKNGGVK